MEAKKELIEKLIQIIADSTASKEFKAYCMHFLEQGVIPPPLLDHWYYGSRTSLETTNNNFLSCFTNFILKDHLKHDIKVQVPTISSETSNDKQILKWELEIFKGINTSGTKPWNHQYEGGNESSFYDYFPGNEQSQAPSWHSLTTHPGFDFWQYMRSQAFAVHPSGQPPVNNRDFGTKYVKEKKGEKYDMFEYITNHPNAETDSQNLPVGNHRYEHTSGHFILVKRMRKDDISESFFQNPKIKNNLSNYCHMQMISSTDNTDVTRYQGVKLLGEPVAVSPTSQDANDFFRVLTVSSPS